MFRFVFIAPFQLELRPEISLGYRHFLQEILYIMDDTTVTNKLNSFQHYA